VEQNSGWESRPVDEHSAIRRLGHPNGFAAGSTDCGMLVALEPGLYTVALGGVGDASGMGLFEVIQATGFGIVPQSSTHFINISNLCLVADAAGATLDLQLPLGRRLLIRAVGPGLTRFGVPGALANPRLELIRPLIATSLHGGVSTIPAAVVHTNDDWNAPLSPPGGADPETGMLRPLAGLQWLGSTEELRTATAKSYAFPLEEGTPDAAMFVAVNSPPMQLRVSGSDGGTGLVLVEIYDVDAL
jgi:hypothetical protein